MIAAAALAASPIAHARHKVKTHGFAAGQAAYWTNNTQPSSGDDMYVRNAMHEQARNVSGKMFGALQSLLHGENPNLNFVSPGSPLVGVENGTSANVDRSFGQEPNSINLDSTATAALINPDARYHNWAVQVMPHEFAHLRQTPDVLASVGAREGGAQLFADNVTKTAALQAGIPFYAGPAGSYDADYAQYVQNVNQYLGRDWALFKQFGNPVGVYP